jgi:hypothetical protein
MVLDSDGNVGIGTTTPTVLLDINSASSNDRIALSHSGTSRINFGVTSGNVFYMFHQATSSFPLWINASANVGIGTTTDSGYKLDVNGTARLNSNVTIGNGTTTTSKLTILATTGVVAPGSPTLGIYDEASPTFGFDFSLEGVATGDLYLSRLVAGTRTSVLQIARATGAATFSSSVTTGAGLSLSGATAPASGIEFPATQVASASANNLDDYEEGTFTPTSSGGITINTIPNATYTKIGNIVTFQIWIKVDITSVNFVISGLPFATSGRTSASVSNISNGQVISNQVVNNEIYGYSAVVGLDDDLLIGGNYRVA